MKKILLILSCMSIGMQLMAEHSWAQCAPCQRPYRQNPSLKSSFDPEWDRWCEGGACEEDDSELVNAV